MAMNNDAAEILLFAIPKAFIGDAVRIQRNALSSWVLLPGIRIVLLGDDAGIEEAAEEFGVGYVGELEKTRLGTPLISSAFEWVREHADVHTACYVNADLILFEEFVQAIRAVSLDPVLMTGQRRTLEISSHLSLSTRGGETALRVEAERRGRMDPPWALDYFAFRTHTHWNMPGFAVGRPGWDNWLIYRARSLGIPVVDLTEHVAVIHQAHSYHHVPKATDSGFEGPEADANRSLVKTRSHFGDLSHATHVLREGKVRRPWSIGYIRSRILALPWRFRWTAIPVNNLRRLIVYRKELFATATRLIDHVFGSGRKQ